MVHLMVVDLVVERVEMTVDCWVALSAEALAFLMAVQTVSNSAGNLAG